MLNKTIRLLLELVALELCDLHKTRHNVTNGVTEDLMEEDYYMFIVEKSKVYFIIQKELNTGKITVLFKNVYTFLDFKAEVTNNSGVDKLLTDLVRQSMLAYVPNLVLKINKVDSDLMSKVVYAFETPNTTSYMLSCRKG